MGTLIDQLSALPECKKVHLFLSGQSTFSLSLGKRFQEGIHKNWVIYNFNGGKGCYDWALELSKNGVKLRKNPKILNKESTKHKADTTPEDKG